MGLASCQTQYRWFSHVLSPSGYRSSELLDASPMGLDMHQANRSRGLYRPMLGP